MGTETSAAAMGGRFAGQAGVLVRACKRHFKGVVPSEGFVSLER